MGTTGAYAWTTESQGLVDPTCQLPGVLQELCCSEWALEELNGPFSRGCHCSAHVPPALTILHPCCALPKGSLWLQE